MKPTTKILSVFIATQIAFSCFALAVETTKKKSAPLTKAKVTASKKTVTSSTKTKTVVKKPVGKTEKVNAAKPAIVTEPKESIQTEIETIEQMEAAAAVAVAPIKTTGKAITPATTSATKATPAAETKFVNYNISLGATYNTAAEAPEKGPRGEYMSYDLIPSITIGPVKTLAWFMYKQNLVDNNTSEWQDFPIASSLAKPYNAGDYITLNPAVVITVPQTKASKDGAQLNYAANANVTIGLNTKTVGLDGMVLNWQTGYTKMNNEFTTSSAGEPLVSYRFRQRLNFWYPIIENLNFKSRVQFDSNFSYENVTRNTFFHFVALEYRFITKYTVSMGHANSGTVLADTTYEQNFKFYDSKSSEYFLGLGADF